MVRERQRGAARVLCPREHRGLAAVVPRVALGVGAHGQRRAREHLRAVKRRESRAWKNLKN